jgi:DEAD/DEAH box helicase domain-containing protein
MIQTTVTNKGPQLAELASLQIDLLNAFRSVLPIGEQDSAIPFEHQATGWQKILEAKEVGLVAGTAAGKTLTAAVPLFDKLFRQKTIQKILFLYPTLALMDDQYHTLQKLLKHYISLGLTEKDAIGRVRGGLSSTQLIGALSKPIIVATPDSVYWFFRKNVKYNAFLIYGLLQVDEVVIDEAHLFSGLMLQNADNLLKRMRFLKKEYLGRTLKVHYLTATSNIATQKLSPGAYPPIPGRSKCGDVDLIIETKMPIWEREPRMADLSREMLTQNKKQILVVCNSARRAHRIFDSLRDNRRSTEAPDLPDIFWRTFGLVP